jgi:hypothetical protein
VTISVVSAIAIVSCAVFLFRSEKQISQLTAHRRAFDTHTREADDALSDLRAGQQAYVAVGQGLAFWAPKVAQTEDLVTKTLASLRESATSTSAQSALDEVAATLTQFAEVDKRTRDYLKGGQQLMAGDVVFTEGVETAATAMLQLEMARQAEAQSLDLEEGKLHKLEADALGATAGLATLAIVLLAFSSGSSARTSASSSILQPVSDFPAAASSEGLSLRTILDAPPISRPVSPVLKTAARLCTDFARVQDLNGLKSLIAQAAETMDAGGLVVWMGNATGADLRPMLTHGYSEQVLARMPKKVPRTADNAAAAAYRTGLIQIVPCKTGGGAAGAPGAIVAPIISTEGCVGALSAEIRGGGEGSESVQALATIFAAQLAGVLTPTATETATAEPKTAAQL